MKKLGGLMAAGGASLIAMALLLTPAFALPSQHAGKQARRAPSLNSRSLGAFTPAVADPRLAAALARRGSAARTSGFRFTPALAANDRSRAVRVAVRARAATPAEAARATASPPPAASTAAVASIIPSSYNLGVSVGWRRFAVSGDVSTAEGGVISGLRDSAQVGMSYRANQRLTGRVQVGAERADGAQRIVADDQAYSLDVGGSYSIARNLDVTGGVRYRISRDRLEPLALDERRDSQAVYVGTAFRF